MTRFIWAWLTAMYAALIDTGALLETGELVLLGEPLEDGGESEEADIVRPTFTGYADEAIAAFVPAVDVDGKPYLAVPPTVFTPTDAVNLPQSIYGIGILDSAGDLVCFCNFAVPITLNHADQQLHATGRIKFSDTLNLEMEAYVE